MAAASDFVRVQNTINAIQNILGVKFPKNPHLIWEACQSYRGPNNDTIYRKIPREANKRLAQVGDSCADLWIWHTWYTTSPTPRGNADDVRQLMLSNKNLAVRARALGFEKHLGTNPGTEFISDMMLATMVEALIGAAFEDGGFGFAAKVIEALDLGADL